ncbi:Holliday junction resolvase RecU [Anaerotalea alkaliphila]|uniref:Holliday junction resolvase RecU n=1 Tax=Anaerotalea alkaliphila TaxID=2662126 RepID=A0A7X5KN16_9FIRM|nr:Holliday junction resolvase RecU [Anaerotalea alkaliphila]NDL66332.1 Holliday junction resolvase RecU [Anaerotalea alkaliphila]
MGFWRTRGLRGSALEELVNHTNDKYRERGLALVQKVPTPIKPVELDPANGNIRLAFFEQRSTVDYIGVVQGVPICFDAKETNKERFPLQNIHEHQLRFMEDFERQEGVAFLLVNFTQHQEFYFLPFGQLKESWDLALQGGRKSIPYRDFKKAFPVYGKDGYLVHYLEGLAAYLEQK